MEVERIFSADQIKIHPDLAQILREYTKAVIRANPNDVIEFSWNYFRNKVEEEEARKMNDWKPGADGGFDNGSTGGDSTY